MLKNLKPFEMAGANEVCSGSVRQIKVLGAEWLWCNPFSPTAAQLLYLQGAIYRTFIRKTA
jgi:hypothetical protein